MSDRSVFLYLGAERGSDKQCGTCHFWIEDDRCHVHRPRDKITASMSCDYYLHGKPDPEQRPMSLTTPELSGLVDRDVRCENCKWFDDGNCGFYSLLNRKLPDVFKLDTSVDAKGCCNAQEPEPESKQREKRLAEEAI